MFKIFITLFIFSISTFALTINFSEEKYHEAIDSSFTKEGNITFLDNSIEVAYKDDDAKVIYHDENLTIVEKGEKKEIDLESRPEVKMFFTLFRAIYFEDKALLEEFFKLTVFDGVTTLSPNAVVSNYIDKVRYKKSRESNNSKVKLDFLEINFALGDRVRIEEI